ncbi:MAG: hypothetical protein ABWJ42_05820 [Sulfolobales archaeon]
MSKNTVAEILSIKRSLGDIVRERLKLELESFLEPEISEEYFRLAIERIKRDLGLKNTYDTLNIDVNRGVISLHLMLALINLIEDSSIREKILDREIESMRRFFERLNDVERESTLIELANSLGLNILRSREEDQLIVYSAYSKNRVKTKIYGVKIRLLDFLRILAQLKLYEKHDLKRLPVKNGFVYIALIDFKSRDTTLLEILLDIVRYIMKELSKNYGDYVALKSVKRYSEEISKIVGEAKREFIDLYTRNMIRVIESISKLEPSLDKTLFPKCINIIIEKISRNEDLDEREVYLLSTFLAYTGIPIEEIGSELSERYGYLTNIIARIRDLSSRGVYYFPPSCAYIKRIMKIEDDECVYRNPLQAYRRRLLNRQ